MFGTVRAQRAEMRHKVVADVVEALAAAFYSGGGGIAGAAALLRELGVLPAAPRVRAAPRSAAAAKAAAPRFGARGTQDAVEGTAPRCGFRGPQLCKLPTLTESLTACTVS